ncbi:dolichol-phosphate mannosyltransferase [Streptomyces sp. SAI-170]|uniref:GtrA family protein n=1 Tax=Streptomyces sp. SAI-170 TaxID=3377729 RepID=UPI003C7D8F5B
MTAQTADVSVVVPAFDRSADIPELLTRVRAGMPAGLRFEVVLADDTRQMVQRATAPWIVVLDAGLPHPPELIPALIAQGEATGAELVVAGGSGAGGGHRRLLAKSVFPRALHGLSDPLSGLFAIRRAAVERAASSADGPQPLGHRILLELAVRCRPRGIAEVPYTFGGRHTREAGSKGLHLLRHLVALRTADPRARAIVFGLIGLSGFAPNLLLLWLLHGWGLAYTPAEILANQAGLLWNFTLIDSLVYRDQRRHRRRAVRLLSFAAVGNVDLVARIPLAALLMGTTGMTAVPATALAMVLVFTARFLVVDRLLYRRPHTPGTVPARVAAPEPVG